MPDNSGREIKKSDVINAILNYMMSKEFSSISAQKENFRKPPLIESKKENQKFRPDLSANLSGKVHLFEIETDPEEYDKPYTIRKWEVLSDYAVNQGGLLNLVVPNEFESNALSAVEENGIDAKILQVSFK